MVLSARRLWDYSLEGGPLPQSPTLPQGMALWGGRLAQGVPCPPKSGRKSQSGSSRSLAPVTAPCQHLPAEPAQMLQECGSATTRYCRNVDTRRVGKGRAGALLPLLSPSPSIQQAAAHAPCLGKGPHLWNWSPLCKCLSPPGCKEPLLSLLLLTWAGKWMIW